MPHLLSFIIGFFNVNEYYQPNYKDQVANQTIITTNIAISYSYILMRVYLQSASKWKIDHTTNS